jgi:hypothetical protein
LSLEDDLNLKFTKFQLIEDLYCSHFYHGSKEEDTLEKMKADGYEVVYSTQ